MNKIKKLLGIKIKNIRLAYGLTQDGFCEKIGIEIPTLSNIENGKSFPLTSTLMKIIEEFKVEPNELFNFSYLENEELLDKRFLEIYNKLPLSKKQYLYRLVNFLFELGK